MILGIEGFRLLMSLYLGGLQLFAFPNAFLNFGPSYIVWLFEGQGELGRCFRAFWQWDS